MPAKGYVEIECQIIHTTERGVLIFDGADKVWLPKSQIEEPEEFPVGEHVTILIPEWLAQDKGLI